jgi:hypothetical protein
MHSMVCRINTGNINEARISTSLARLRDFGIVCYSKNLDSVIGGQVVTISQFAPKSLSSLFIFCSNFDR